MDSKFPQVLIECPHWVVASIGYVDFCTTCGAQRTAVTQCDHGVSLSDPCEQCGEKMPEKSWWERLKARL